MKEESIISRDACLPDILFAPAFMGAQGRMVRVVGQERELCVDVVAKLGQQLSVGLEERGRINELHRAG